MIENKSPLQTFPPAATKRTTNSEVAQQSLNGNKRKRAMEGLAVPKVLQHLVSVREDKFYFEPTSTEDVSDIVKFAAAQNLTVSVLSPETTNTHGLPRGGDVVLQLSAPAFRKVEVDRSSMRVTVGGGVTSRLVDTILSQQNMTTPLVGYTVGLGAFLSGGFGFASRLHGLTVDNFCEAEIVIADGSILTVNNTDHHELFWSLQGCGTSFGVVTSITLKCYPLRRSLSSNVIYPFEPATGAKLLQHWRDVLADAPDELYSNFVLAAGPDAPNGAVAILQITHLGSVESGMPYVERLAEFDGVKYHFKDCNEITYLRQQELVEAVLKGATVDTKQRPESQIKYLLDGNVLTDLPDDITEESCRLFHERAKAGAIWCLELFGGACGNVDSALIPQSHRKGRFHAASILRVPVERPETWSDDQAGREWIRGTISKVSPGGPLPSFLTSYRDDPREARLYHNTIRGSFGHENWRRLKATKKEYDPLNMFDSGLDSGMLGIEESLIDGV